jgi:hypothetical protein
LGRKTKNPERDLASSKNFPVGFAGDSTKADVIQKMTNIRPTGTHHIF